MDDMMQDKSTEWAKIFRKLKYFDIRDCLYFFIIFVGIFWSYFKIAKMKIFGDILSRFWFLVYRDNIRL